MLRRITVGMAISAHAYMLNPLVISQKNVSSWVTSAQAGIMTNNLQHRLHQQELHAVKYTNAKLDGISRIDPDEVAATAEVLFYAGEIKKFECHGKFKYQVNRLDRWDVQTFKSFEEQRLLHYQQQWAKNHSIQEKCPTAKESQLVFSMGQKPVGSYTSSLLRKETRRVLEGKPTSLLRTNDDSSKQPDETPRNEAARRTTSDTTEAKENPQIILQEQHDQEKSESGLGDAHVAESEVTCEEGSAVNFEKTFVKRPPGLPETPLRFAMLSGEPYSPPSPGYSFHSLEFLQGNKPKCKSILEGVIPSPAIRKDSRVVEERKFGQGTFEKQNAAASRFTFGPNALMTDQPTPELVEILDDQSFPKLRQIGPVTSSISSMDAAASCKAQCSKNDPRIRARIAERFSTYTGTGTMPTLFGATALESSITERQGIEESLKQNSNSMDCRNDSLFEQRIIASKEAEPCWVNIARAKADSGITSSTSKKDDISISLAAIEIKTCAEKSEEVKSSDVYEEKTSALIEEERKADRHDGACVEKRESTPEEWPSSYDERVSINEPLTNLGPYEDDVENIMLSHLSYKIGLAYYRNPFSLLDVFPASPADTVVGVSDQFQSLFVRFRVVPHGKGKLMTSDGNVIYVGNFKDGKKDGFGSGIVVDPSTDIYHGTGYYQGHWKKNCRHGAGSLKLVSGMHYNGEWYLDKPHGNGILRYPDGSVLKGHFAGGAQEGCFVYYSSEGCIELRDYQSGNLLSSKVLQSPNGLMYTQDYSLINSRHLCKAVQISASARGDGSQLFSSDNDDEDCTTPVETSFLAEAQNESDLIKQDFNDAAIVKSLKGVDRSVKIKSTMDLEVKHSTKEIENRVKSRSYESSFVKEIELENVLQHFMSAFQKENEFFVRHQLSAVKICSEEMLQNAKDELCEITNAHQSNVSNLLASDTTNEGFQNINSKIDDLTSKFDGLLDLCRSMLDKQDETEKRISALDVHVADISSEKIKKETEALQKCLEEKDAQLSMAENLYKCQICHECRQDCVIMPCMHMQTCSKCLAKIRSRGNGITAKCPICRANIHGEINIKLL